MTSFASLRVEARGETEIVTLDRADTMNALDLDMVDDLSRYFEGLHGREEVRVVILRAEGRAFSAGADLDSTAFAAPGPGRAQRQLAMQKRYSRVPRLMRSCPQPIIAIVQGAACGGGFSLTLAADVRFATPDARFNAAYLRIGLGSGDMGSSYFLPRLVGLSAASEFLLSGRFITAERAKAIGLVSDVLPPEACMEAALALADDMLRASPLGLRMSKDCLNAAVDANGLEAAMAIEDRQQAFLSETADHREAVAAFREKRGPRYSNQ